MKPDYQRGDVTLYCGDCLDVLPHIAPVATVITDPPYGLGFMGKAWDHGVPGVPFWERMPLLPGGMLLAFGGTRTWHRLACAVEDAGFDIRDTLMWLYGQGFPKSHDISKAMDKRGGDNGAFHAVRKWLREMVKAKGLRYRDIDEALGNVNSHKASHYLDNSQPQIPTPSDWAIIKGLLGVDEDIEHPARFIEYEREVIGYRKVQRGVAFSSDGPDELPITVPATAAAALWDGWGTALKPAWEPIVLAMRPLDGTFAANAERHGVAGLNIDGARIPTGDDTRRSQNDGPQWSGKFQGGRRINGGGTGRWPANVVLDAAAAELLDEMSGECGAFAPVRRGHDGTSNGIYGDFAQKGDDGASFRGRVSGASRFFYCAKASRKERTCGGTIDNDHPTVKPLKLMEWLCLLTMTPTGGTVLDPFMGSGSTIGGAIAAGRPAIGIESDRHNFDISVARTEAWLDEKAEQLQFAEAV